jgi:hypothetical protein
MGKLKFDGWALKTCLGNNLAAVLLQQLRSIQQSWNEKEK